MKSRPVNPRDYLRRATRKRFDPEKDDRLFGSGCILCDPRKRRPLRAMGAYLMGRQLSEVARSVGLSSPTFYLLCSKHTRDLEKHPKETSRRCEAVIDAYIEREASTIS